MKKDRLESLRDGEHLSLYEHVMLIVKLSLPAIMAQLSSIIMQYIDASMVGRLSFLSEFSEERNGGYICTQY